MASNKSSEIKYYGGIEGGGTASNMVLIDSHGKVVGTSDGLDTNHWLIGVEACAERVNDMVVKAKEKAGIDINIPLVSLGLSLSGGESEHFKTNMRQTMLEKYPNCSQSYYICTDTYGSIAIASPTGGIVLIAGTGSNCQLINPNGDVHGCGGWGHMLGDEGSGYWIAHRAIKMVLDETDGLTSAPHDITFVKSSMYKYFKMTQNVDILKHFYGEGFTKPNAAHFTSVLAEGALNQKDPLCKYIFHEAGQLQGRHIIALEKKIDQRLVNSSSGLQVLCVGSVFKSWSLLKEGFISGLKSNGSTLQKIVLLSPKVKSSVGAAILGAKAIKENFPVDYSENTETFFTYNAGDYQ